MVNDKISTKSNKIKDEVQLAKLKKTQPFEDRDDDGGDEGGGGAGKRKGHSYRSEGLQKMVAKGALKGTNPSIKEFLLRHDGKDPGDLKDTPLHHDAKEQAESADADLSDSALEAQAKERVQEYLRDIRETEQGQNRQPADSKNRTGSFFGKDAATRGNVQQAFAKILAGQGANHLGVAKQSNIGSVASGEVAAAKRGGGLAGSVAVAAAGFYGNNIGAAVQQRGLNTIKSHLEQSTASSENASQESPRASMGKRK